MNSVWINVGAALALALSAPLPLYGADQLIRAALTLETRHPSPTAVAKLETLGFAVDGSSFVRAVTTAHRPLIELFLAAAVDVNAADADGCTPLFAACASQQWELAAALLKLGADPNRADDRGRTPLMATVIHGHEATVSALLDRGADPQAEDESEHTALHFAVIAKREKFIAPWLPGCSDLTTACCENGGLFDHALETQEWKIIEPILVKMPPTLNWNSATRSWLTDSLRTRDVARARLLLSKHADPPTPEGRKQPLLAYALVDDDRAAFQLLLDAGADPNTPLATPAEKEFRDLLPKSTVREYLEFEPGMNVLMLAAGLGRTDYVKLLLDRGAERFTATTSKSKLVPLYFAAWAQSAESQQLLLGSAPSPDEARVEISLGSQRATFLRQGVPVVTTRISTGRPGYRTPEGRFVVTDKHPTHSSTIYKVPMPFFMRLSCREFGLHEGNTSSEFASHGCIRVPAGTIQKLFRDVPVGTLVTISP